MTAHTTLETTVRKALEQALGHQFKDASLLQQAFVHRSYLHEQPQYPLGSNERLEFLGDALLDYAIAEELYRLFPEEPEGTLTKLRASLVQRDSLAGVAQTLGLGNHLLMGRGEERSGGRKRASNLSCVYEAVVGAILMDGGEAAAKTFVLSTLKGLLDATLQGDIIADHKSRLQEYCQANQRKGPDYQTISEEGPPHAKRFSVEVSVDGTVLGTGIGQSRQQAEKEAARAALEAILK